MAFDSSTSPSTLLPLLPVEVKSTTIRFCDPSTLGQVSQVCLAFLELAFPLVYEDAVLIGPEALESFFCERPSSTQQAHLAPFLSLSQTRSITFLPDGLITRELRLHKDRLPFNVLPLDTLTLRPKAFETREAAARVADERTWTSFLSLLNPLRVSVIGIRDDLSKPYALFPSVALHEKTLEWKRVELLEFTNASASRFLGYSFFLILIGREAGGSPSPLQIVYNLHQQWQEYPNVFPIDRIVLYDLSWLGNDGAAAEYGHPIFTFPFVDAVVRVRDEDEGWEFMEDIEHGWSAMDTSDGAKTEWRKRLRFEVVEMEEDEDEEASSESENDG